MRRERIRELVLFDLELLALLILATRLATAIHELIGHGLTGILLGGQFQYFRISLFGGGFTKVVLPPSLSAFPLFLQAMGGIGLNLLTGVLFLAWAERARHATLEKFAILFGGASLIGALQYLVSSSYYYYGDIVDWVRTDLEMQWVKLVWIVALPLMAISTYLFVKRYLQSLRSWFPTRRFLKSTLSVVYTLGVVVLVYGLLFHTYKEELVMVEAKGVAEGKIVHAAKAEKLTEMIEEGVPGAEEMEVEDVELDLKEVKFPFPITYLSASLALIAGLIAMLRSRALSGGLKRKVSPRAAFLTLAIALIVLTLLYSIRAGV